MTTRCNHVTRRGTLCKNTSACRVKHPPRQRLVASGDGRDVAMWKRSRVTYGFCGAAEDNAAAEVLWKSHHNGVVLVNDDSRAYTKTYYTPSYDLVRVPTALRCPFLDRFQWTLLRVDAMDVLTAEETKKKRGAPCDIDDVACSTFDVLCHVEHCFFAVPPKKKKRRRSIFPYTGDLATVSSSSVTG